MCKVKFCRFGKDIAKRLVDVEKTHEWLISEVKKDTGLFFDSSYLHKVKTGQLKTPSIVKSICKILNIDYIADKKEPPPEKTG